MLLINYLLNINFGFARFLYLLSGFEQWTFVVLVLYTHQTYYQP